MTRASALALTVLTGFSGLVYEVSWEKVLATLLGSHSEATAAVLALFLGGMSAGYVLWGRVARRLVARHPGRARGPLLRAYGALEIAIGLYALAFPALFAAVRALSTALPDLGPGPGFALDLALSALLIGPPAVAMGGTIPLLTQALARSLADATRIHAWIYGTNTAGAFAGALAAGFWLVPALGLVGCLRAMAALNLLAGAAFLALGRRDAPVAQAAPLPPAAAATATAPPLAYAAVALLVGFAMMTLQTSLIRLGALSFGASQFTFSMVVAVFVLCIALGSFAVSALGDRIPRLLLPASLAGLFALLVALYTRLDAAPYYAHALRALFRDEPAAFYPFQLAALLALLGVLGPAVILSGASLPLLFHALRRELGGLGDLAGHLYSANTVGSLLGALLGGYALFFWLDLDQVYRVALAALALAAALAAARTWPGPRPAISMAAAAAAAGLATLGLLALPSWQTPRLSAGLFRERTPGPHSFAGPDAFFAHRRTPTQLFYEDGPTASIAVLEYGIKEGQPDRVVVTNGKSDSSTWSDYTTMAMAALLPGLFAEQTERAFVVGYGAGVTVGELARLEGMREVVVAEISRGVIRAAPLFDYANGGASHHPAVRIVHGDAYRSLIRAEGHFDIIASEPSNPWVIGVEMLYSREFLEAARDRLAPGGVYAQWIHTYEIDDESIALALRTYAAVFPDVAVWYGEGYDLLLLGFRDPARALDLPRLLARAARPDLAAGLRRCRIESAPALLAHELLPLGVLHAAALQGPLHTLLHPRLSHAAARAFFSGGEGRAPVTANAAAARTGRTHSLWLRYAARAGGASEAERSALVAETCRHRPRECVTLLAAWRHDAPESPAREALVAKIRLDPVWGRITPLAEVEKLAALFDPGAAPRTGRERILNRAVRGTEDFVRYYHHGAPFAREVLAALWARCDAATGGSRECALGRAEAQRLLGRLRAPAGRSGA